jgi:hypothetical protein
MALGVDMAGAPGPAPRVPHLHSYIPTALALCLPACTVSVLWYCCTLLALAV